MSCCFILCVYSLPTYLWLPRQPMMGEGVRPTVNLGCSGWALGWKAQMLGISIQFILILWNKPSGRGPILCPHREKQIYKRGQGCSGSESITRDAPLFWCPGHAPEQARGSLVESKHLCFWRLMGDFHVQSRFGCIKIPLGFSGTGSSRKWYGNDFWRSAALPWFSGDTWLRCLCLSGEVQTPLSPGDTLWEGRISNRVSVNFSVLFSRCGWLVPSPRTEPLTKSTPDNSRTSHSSLLYFSGLVGWGSH